MRNNILIAKDIVKQYGNYTALNHVNIAIPEGCIFGLLGPNGAGKTTLMRIINQIIAPDSGTLIFDGKPLKREDIAKIGYLPEERGLYKKMKVGEQALYLAKLKGMAHNEAIEKLQFWFKRLDILDWWNKKVEELSKGMAQKIQFVVTVIHNPKLLIFDEPFSGFDPINAAIIRKEILALSKSGTSIIFSTHRMESVEEICNYIALINKGETVLQGPIEKIKKDFRNNTFSTEIKAEKLILSDYFEIIHQKNECYQIRINNNATSNDLLNELMKNGEIISFEEKIPTMEDIFIKAVQDE
ncbi:MAG: ATP-binding cassette domain-containing protein [Bacteroidota bacterium]|nr:ATP-binding cassette domain-containing protein [Bacteroidota bacterium]